MRLSDLIETETNAKGLDSVMTDVEIRGLAADSRDVAPGFLFAALAGSRADGRGFIADALARGAAAILATPGTQLPAAMDNAAPVPLVTDPNPRRRLALMAARFHPRQPRHIAAVTGTNGKTSVAVFARQIWTILGTPAASLGTLGLSAPSHEDTAALTTPDPVALHRDLQALAEEGVNHLALEASSHGLDQCRLDGVRVAAAAFTNLSRDHLDYHRDTAAYFAAKARLFDTVMAPGGIAVLNADTTEYAALAGICERRGHRVITYGRSGDFRLDKTVPHEAGQRLALTIEGKRHDVDLALPGAFQAENALCALALVIALGGDPAASVAALGQLAAVPGRIERVARHPSGAPVYVDYAHTPDALAHVLAALRPHTDARLVVLFGCGGDRDAGKRPQMGEIAARLADRVIVTDDNPRGEDAGEIRRQIVAACPGASEIGDRKAAIQSAIADLAAGDILVIAGKGHEQGQIHADTVQPFDDRAIARDEIAALGGEVLK